MQRRIRFHQRQGEEGGLLGPYTSKRVRTWIYPLLLQNRRMSGTLAVHFPFFQTRESSFLFQGESFSIGDD